MDREQRLAQAIEEIKNLPDEYFGSLMTSLDLAVSRSADNSQTKTVSAYALKAAKRLIELTNHLNKLRQSLDVKKQALSKIHESLSKTYWYYDNISDNEPLTYQDLLNDAIVLYTEKLLPDIRAVQDAVQQAENVFRKAYPKVQAFYGDALLQQAEILVRKTSGQGQASTNKPSTRYLSIQQLGYKEMGLVINPFDVTDYYYFVSDNYQNSVHLKNFSKAKRLFELLTETSNVLDVAKIEFDIDS